MNKDLPTTLFASEDEKTYAVIDGASCDELLEKIGETKPAHVCLYAGELAPDVQAAAPHLVQLEADSDFTRWLLDEGWGKHWGIFAVSTAGIKELRKHFRTFLLVKGPDGQKLYFRFYDPRVLRSFLPISLPAQLQAMFGPLARYYAEGEKDEIIEYSYESAELKIRPLTGTTAAN